MGSTFALLGSLVVAGLMIGAGLNLFAEEKAAAGGETGGPPTEAPPTDPANQVLVARDNLFANKTQQMPPNTAVTVKLDNKGRSKHNVHYLTARGGQTLVPGAEGEIIDGGTSETLSFTTPGPGSYYYQCDVHPDTMTGTLTVQ